MHNLQGLHTYLIHNPERTIARVHALRRADGKPRTHKVMVHGDTADWLDRMPADTLWVIRNYNLSEQILTDEATAARLGREHAEAHARYMASAEGRGVTRDRLLFEGRNEPQPAEQPFVAAYECARIARAAELGVPRLVVCNFGVGQPTTIGGRPDTAADWSRFEVIRKAMRPGDRLGLHAYFGIEGPLGEWSTGGLRWPDEPARHLQCPWSDVKILLTEAGLDDGVNQRPKQGWHFLPGAFEQKAPAYLDMVRTCERQYLLDPRIEAVMLFTHDYENNEWDKFDIADEPFWSLYESYCRAGTQPDYWGDTRTSRWRLLIEHAACATGLDPRVVATVLAMESAGRVDATSNVGAVGLMQVMPAETMAGRPPRIVLLHPRRNIEYGCGILRGALAHFNGRLPHALAAYYMGIGGVERKGLGSPDATKYLNTFRLTWAQLWPGVPCPVDAPSATQPGVDPALSSALTAAACEHQALRLNAQAALQKAIAAAGYWPTSGEFRVASNGTEYVAQRAEHPATGMVRVYACKAGEYDKIFWVKG